MSGNQAQRQLRVLSLFSGYEGFGLGLQLALGRENIRHVGYVEIEPYCQEILKARIRDGYLDWAPIIRDIRCADFRPMAGLVDCVTAGFPCQPHSTAGARKGHLDDRDLWPETAKVIGQVGPQWVLLENVDDLLFRTGGRDPYLWRIIRDLTALGYVGHWGVLGAHHAGHPHLRERVWVLAYPRSEPSAELHPSGSKAETGQWLQGIRGEDWVLAEMGTKATRPLETWAGVEPFVSGGINGTPCWMDRIGAVGNGIVPAVVQRFLQG